MSGLPARIVTLATRLDSLEIDALLVSDEVNVRYLSGFTGDSSFLLVQDGRVTILSDGRYEAQIAAECPLLECVIRRPEQRLPELLPSLLSDLGVQRLGFEAEHLSVAAWGELQRLGAGVDWVETAQVVERQRMVKDAEEIAITRRAVEVAESSFRAVLADLSPRCGEREIAYRLESEMRQRGAEGVSFPPIVAAGASGALPHYRPRDETLDNAATLLIDWGACQDGYASDLTRTLHRSHASDRFRAAYGSVWEAQLAAIDAIGPGVSARDVDAAARRVLARDGLADAFKHGLGHGIGLQIHESPRMSAASFERLQPGMIITVEPGVYFDGDFGIRIEDDVLVTEGGCEVLSSLPKGLDECRLML